MTDRAATLPAPRTLAVSTALIAGLALLALSISVAVSVGAVTVPLSTVWGVVADRLMPGRSFV